MTRFRTSLLILLCFTCNSCNNEIDLFNNGPVEAIAYGIIDPQDTIHIVRVQKTYVREIQDGPRGSNEDIYFDSVKVFLSGIREGETVWKKEMIKTKWEKDSGYFPNDEHYVYKLEGHLPYSLPNKLQPDEYLEYFELQIDIIDIGLTAKAQSCVLSPAFISIGNPFNKQIELYGSPSVIGLSQQRGRLCGRPYYGELGFKIYITEHGFDEPLQDSLIWKTNNFDTPGYSKYTLTPEKLFNRIMMGIEQNKDITARTLDSIHLFCMRPDMVFTEYWNTRINRMDHDYPPFSNFDSIYGMLLCVSTGYRTGFYLSQKSKDSLCYGEKWKHLKFKPW